MKAVPKQRSRPRRRAFRPWLLLFRLLLWSFVAVAAWCIYVLWLVNSFDTKQTYPQLDAGIVLGAALWNNKPSPALRERLELALRLYEAGTVERLILSGGHGGLLSTLSEAEGMRNYLVEAGVPEDKLILEPEAANTYQNIAYSKALGEAAGLTDFLIITHDYHAPRAREIAVFAGLEEAKVAAISSKVLNPYYNDTREVLAYTKWKLEWILLKLGILSRDSLL